jgi:hypothetical protein
MTYGQQQQQQQQQAQSAEPSPRAAAGVRVFEARPMSANDLLYNNNEFATSGGGSPTTWRRTYILDSRRTERVDERNEILTSEERLHRERFDIDLLKVSDMNRY